VPQVGPEGEEVERKEERDRPFDNGSRILVLAIEKSAESDGESDQDGGEDGFEDVCCAEGTE